MKSQRKIGLVFSVLQIGVSSFVGLLFTPFLIKSLGTVEYGLYQLLYATVGYFALLDFGLGSTITQFILKKDEERPVSVDSVISICLKIYGVIDFIILLLIVFVSDNLQKFYPASITIENLQYAKLLFRIMGLTTCISLISHALSGIENAFEQYTATKGIRLLQQIVRVMVLVILFNIGMKAIAIVMVDFILAIAILLFDVLFCKIKCGVRFFAGVWDYVLFKRIATFSIFVFLQLIVTQVNNSVDRVLLGRYASLEMVSLYAVCMQLYNMFNSLGGVIPGVSVPQISRTVYLDNSNIKTTDYCAKLSRYQCFLLFLLMGGFICVGEHFISIWTKEYNAHEVWIIVMLICLPQILEFIETPIFYVMKAKELQAGRSIILASVALGNILISIALIRIFPVYGCAIGTFLSFVIGNNIIANMYYHKKVGIIIPRYFKIVFKGILPAWIISLITGFFINKISIRGINGFLVKGILYCFIYFGLILCIGTNRNEKKMIHTICLKVKEKFAR